MAAIFQWPSKFAAPWHDNLREKTSWITGEFCIPHCFWEGFPPKQKRKPLPRVLWCSGPPMFWSLKTGNQTAMCFLRKVSKVIVAIPASDWILFYSPYDLRYSNRALLRLLDPPFGMMEKKEKKNAPPIWLHERHCLNLPHYIPSHTKKESLPSS